MLVITLDPCFKNMKFIQNYMGNIVVVDVVVEYDVKVVHPLLLYVYFHLNLVKALIDPTTFEDDNYFFGHIIYVDDAIISTLKNELQIFECLCMTNRNLKSLG